MLEIITGGALSTVQDLGRFGVMKNGFTQSGAMDSHSMKLANALLKNDLNAPVIEMTMKGITAWFTEETYFCLSGGNFTAKLNENKIERNTVYKAKKDDIITVGMASEGFRCYLAVGGGFTVPGFMGSASTNLKISLGGYEGRKLHTYDKIGTGTPSADINEGDSLPADGLTNEITVGAVIGPQGDMFTDEDIETFFSSEFTVTNELDRMGIRLEGPELKSKEGKDIISDGIVFGSVQIPNSGKPIILMADHQTTGGYAKIASIINVDMPMIAQCKAGDKIRFVKTDIETAQKAF
ncbi:MAG: biotin-dependent carboxyltransferase family protein, partial [Clostridia bacterium]|nr:biotin-dependent carboxyltransferase family protein [Clostridia bacterium]